VRPILIAVTLSAAFTIAGCHTAPARDHELGCTLVYLKTGPNRELAPDASQRVFAGHFANMLRLAHERQLLVAGPFAEPHRDPALRGIFVLDTPDRARAQQLAETDPGFQAGVFALEYHELATAAPLRAYLAAELAVRDQAERDGKQLEPGAGGRKYVLLTAEHGDLARTALEGHAGVLLFGRLDGTRAFAVLDAQDPDAARALLGVAAGRIGDFVLDPWFASGGLVHLRELPMTR